MKIPLIVKIQILLVNFWIKWLSFWLKIFNNILFFRKINNPRNILIYKIGNIGDIICAIPSFIAIRRFYPESKITLLTSEKLLANSFNKALVREAMWGWKTQ